LRAIALTVLVGFAASVFRKDGRFEASSAPSLDPAAVPRSAAMLKPARVPRLIFMLSSFGASERGRSN
jgi:hypothetical protein